MTDTPPARFAEAIDMLQEAIDLLNALDLIGDAIGDRKGYAISAVAIAARTAADGALDIVKWHRG